MLRCANRAAYAQAYEREVPSVVAQCEEWVAKAGKGAGVAAAAKKMFGVNF